jgi:hypothetical protein
VTLLIEIALVALTGVGLAVCVAMLPEAAPGRGPRGLAPPPSRPAQLVTLERLVALSGESGAVHAHAYLRPVLIQIVSHRLAARGHTLEQIPEPLGREVLGERLWEIVRPGRPFPEDRHGPGVSPRELGAMLEVLERL